MGEITELHTQTSEVKRNTLPSDAAANQEVELAELLTKVLPWKGTDNELWHFCVISTAYDFHRLKSALNGLIVGSNCLIDPI